jgi:hypothetical protein
MYWEMNRVRIAGAPIQEHHRDNRNIEGGVLSLSVSQNGGFFRVKTAAHDNCDARISWSSRDLVTSAR